MATKTKPTRRATPQREARPAVPLGAEWWPTATRLVVLVTSVLVTVAVSTGQNDVYTLPKASILYLGALTVLVLTVSSLATTGGLTVTRSRVLVLAGAVVGVMALATVLGALRLPSLFGEYGRNAGLLTYLSAAVLLAAVLTVFDEERLGLLAKVLAGTAAAVVAYGVVQALGAEPLGAPSSGKVMSTLGQINLVGGYSGVALALLLWLALEPGHSTWQRLLGLVGAVGAVVVGMESHSFQAYGSLAVGGFVVAVVWAAQRWPRRLVVTTVVALIAVVAVAGLVARHPIERQIRDGMSERVLMWQAGRDMVLDRPVLGFGPSGYAAEFSTYRPPAHTRYGVYALVDAPHDVPLSMAVSGGAVLALLYLAFVGWIGVLLVQGLRRTTGRKQLLLAAFGGGWAAYQVQSLVSIDVPTLVVVHFLAAGAITVLSSAPATRTFVISSLVGRRGRGGRRAATTLGQVIVGGAVVVALVLAVLGVFRPLAGDVAYAHGLDDRAGDNLPGAVSELQRATGLAPWVSRYWPDLAGAQAASGDQDAALAAGMHAADLNRSAVSYILSEAQLAGRMNQPDVAMRYFDMAVRRSPSTVEGYRARGEYLASAGKGAEALPDLRKVIEMLPDSLNDRIAIAQLYDELGRAAAAKQAWDDVLVLNPGNPLAVAALKAP